MNMGDFIATNTRRTRQRDEEFILNVLQEPSSDIDCLSDDEDRDVTFRLSQVGDISDSDSDSNEPIPLGLHTTVQELLPAGWEESDRFEPLPAAPPVDDPVAPDHVSPFEGFSRYIPDNYINVVAVATSRLIIEKTGIPTKVVSLNEMKFFGLTIIMGHLKFPRIRMYWASKTRVPIIADQMTRNRYFEIRGNLRCREYNDVTQNEMEKDKFWKVRPLLECLRNACLANPRSGSVSIDEQMIPFWGHVAARQYVRPKPNPCGLKNFVCAASDGLPLDFFLYEGKGCNITANNDITHLDIGGKAVMKLIQTLPIGCNLYVDWYFTSVPLLDSLFSEGYHCTGTIQSSRVPCLRDLANDALLRRKGRGSHSQLIRDDGQVAVIKWFDNKPVMLASTVHGVEPTDEIQRYCKKSKEYVDVIRPHAVAEYNKQMGGVDLLDRLISYYRICGRTRKWTARVCFHFIDFAVVSAWIERRRYDAASGTPQKNRLDLLDFRTEVAESLLLHSDVETSEESDDVAVQEPLHKRKSCPLPTASKRTKCAPHMPEIPPDAKPSRCRFPGCSSPKCRIRCSTCKVFLCLNSNRNCYKAFHEL